MSPPGHTRLHSIQPEVGGGGEGKGGSMIARKAGLHGTMGCGPYVSGDPKVPLVPP